MAARGLALLILLGAGHPGFAADPATDIRLEPTQVQQLGLRLEPVRPTETGGLRGLQARLMSRPADVWLVSAPAAGVVQGVHVVPGEAVKAGQPLLRFASPWLAELQRDTTQATAQLAQAQAQRVRDESLFREGIVPQSRLEQSRVAESVARAARDEKLRQAKIAGVSAGGMGAELSAPFAGRVGELTVSPGQRVEMGTTLARVTRNGPLAVEVMVPRASVGSIAPGARMRVGTAEGKVVGVDPQMSEGTQMAMVRGTLPAAAGLLPGQAVEAEIDTALRGVRLPARALVRSQGRTVCFVAAGVPGAFVAQPVQVLAEDVREAVVSGLAADAQVVVEGTAALKSMMNAGD
ncbi:MAG: efflux RND transporter periplasmic adaptor subunit [Thauera sp.]|nr:efflux RND transporter periplasmic adaptor subunit [Thauera sp.]